ncbi:MAG: tetratricopeptide repeat protein [Bacteroidetes bacterium]|nr:tetratricopeptide repeat protein [Bacteroidota bacterium]
MKQDKNEASASLPDINSMWDYNDPEGTETKFRDLIPKAKASGNDTYYLELMTQVARTQSLQRKFKEAHSILDTVEQQLTDDMTVPKVRYLLERGRTFNSNKQKEKASEQFRKAYVLAKSDQLDFYTVDAAHMLGISEPPEKQLEWNLIAVDIAADSEDPKAKKWLGSLYNNIGWTYHSANEFEKALDMFEKALDYRKGQQDESGTFIAKWCIGRTYRSLHRLEDAIAVHEGLLKETEEKGLDPDGYVYEEMGECLLAGGNTAAAKPYFKTAHELLSKDGWLVANESERLKRLQELGE